MGRSQGSGLGESCWSQEAGATRVLPCALPAVWRGLSGPQAAHWKDSTHCHCARGLGSREYTQGLKPSSVWGQMLEPVWSKMASPSTASPAMPNGQQPLRAPGLVWQRGPHLLWRTHWPPWAQMALGEGRPGQGSWDYCLAATGPGSWATCPSHSSSPPPHCQDGGIGT